MVIVFVVGFVFLGVGSGGLDLQSLVQDVFGKKGSSGTSIAAAQKEVQQHPRSAQAYKQLSDAYRRKGQTQRAISALQNYTTLAPKNVAGLQQLGRLELSVATAAQQQFEVAYFQQQQSSAASTLTGGTKLGQALAQDPLTQAQSAESSRAVQRASSAYQSAVTNTLDTYKRITKLQPTVTNLVELASVALQFNDTTTALKAYRQALALKDVPAVTRRQLRARIKSLEPAHK
jgi:tetratricopeptide (TPR) repeat protein